MRLSTDYYPEYVDFYCEHCDTHNYNVLASSIEVDDVRVHCVECFEVTYVRVIED